MAKRRDIAENDKMKRIVIKGAREHNLKGINLELPRNKLIVVTGLSGSGKSSLAFDTIYAEGQRRYVESLSAYARQFLEQMQKPRVDFIEGLSPAIAIEQRKASSNPRSTVGTVTEIYDYLRLLYARIGIPHCPTCGREVSRQTVQEIVDAIAALPPESKIQILAPLVRGRKGEHRGVLEGVSRQGFVRIYVDGRLRSLDEDIVLDKKRKHTISVVVDRLKLTPGMKTDRLTDSVELALRLGGGLLAVKPTGNEEPEMLFSERFACPHCRVGFEELSPRKFSFNSPHGACPVCSGLGTKMEVDPSLVVPDPSKSIIEGALEPVATPITNRRQRWKSAAKGYFLTQLEAVAGEYGFSLETPFRELSARQKKAVLYGTGGKAVEVEWRRRGSYSRYRTPFEGIINNLERRYRETDSDYVREEIFRKYVSLARCPACGGGRLRPESLAVTVGGISIMDLTALSVDESCRFISELKLKGSRKTIAEEVIKEIRERLTFLKNVGLSYLTLDRSSGSLSGGEAQRIRLATQIGSGLVGVLYVLDEPSIGLHQRDNARLISTLERLRDAGNTVIVVEHDEATIRAADYVVDLGPGAGEEGGNLVVAGTLPNVLACSASQTGRYLSGKLTIPVPGRRRQPRGFLELRGARGHNLKEIDVEFPLGVFCCVTGVSGSGKSTLVEETLSRILHRRLHGSREIPEPYDSLEGAEQVDKVIVIDQAPIGRTPRSNPATYTGIFTPIRALFSKLPLSRLRGYTPGRFSFNVKGGRCEACQGDGMLRIGMHFLPDVYVNCDACGGHRYNRETLEVSYKGKNIAEVLDMSVAEALRFFSNHSAIANRLQTLADVGLGYVRLGQSATTLSGGEAQRIKLSRELGKRSTGRTVYILDEPTTGLHFADIDQLLGVIHRLTDGGNTVIMIEHNLDVIKNCDWLIDLGPEGGEGGGEIVASGTPEDVVKMRKSHTAQFLQQVLALG